MRLGKAPLNAVCNLNRRQRRCLSWQQKLDSDAPVCFISSCQSPFVNLSFEDWLYRRSNPEQWILLLYRNRASVIIGRNQNPWTELDMSRLRDLDIPLVRRRSGGGTVYHDLGNTNYCLLSPRVLFNRRKGCDMVTKAVKKLGIPAYVNERHDICVEEFKVSGSAFKIGGKRAYHHGTMLIDAALHDLRGLLRNTKTRIQSKGVASVSSPVRNLEEWSALIDHDALVEGVADQFLAEYEAGSEQIANISEADMLSVEDVQKGTDELQSWDWLYGQTPQFTHDLSRTFDWGSLDVHLVSQHGLIESLEVQTSGGDEAGSVKAYLQKRLSGERYGSTKGALDDDTGSQNAAVREAVHWLESEM